MKVDEDLVENFGSLLLNRSAEKVIFITSDPVRLIAAKQQGIRALPVKEYSGSLQDTELEKLENYVI